MTSDLDFKLAVFAETVRALASRGRLNAASRDELRLAFQAARAARLTPEQRYSETRADVLQAAEFQLAPSLAKAPSAARSSIAPTRAGRQDADALQTKIAERRPGESPAAYLARVRRTIAKLGARADQSARSIDVTALDQQTEASEREVRYQAAKAAALASPQLKAHETQRAAAVRKSATTFAETTHLDKLARNLMKSRGESLNPKAATFREDYRKALEELSQ